MIVHVSSPTTFHVLDLARQMQRLGHLGKFYTWLPSSMTEGVAKENVVRQPLFLGPLYIVRKLKSPKVHRALNWSTLELFDHWLAAKVLPCDVFHCLSGFGLRAHRAVKEKYGALTVCDRGSSHIAYQDDLLSAEFERWGLPYKNIDPRIIEKEMTEYDECDLITVPSTFVWHSFIERGILADKLAKISFGVDLHEFRAIEKEDRIFRVLYVGQISIRKGIPYLLDALASLRLPDFELDLIGSLKPEAEIFLEKNIGGFNYLGTKRRTELYRYYSQASVFVIASIEEGLALVMAQAMACGLPVIATTNTGAEDLFTDGVEGFIVPIRDPEAIREKVLFLYENQEIREMMGKAALKRARELSGWNTYGECAERAYMQALSDHALKS